MVRAAARNKVMDYSYRAASRYANADPACRSRGIASLPCAGDIRSRSRRRT